MEWKKVGGYALYLVPGYGMYDQFFRKQRGERSTLGIIGSGIYTASFLIKLAILPAYLGKGVSTGDWHPFRFNEKEKTEHIKESINLDKRFERESNLERTIHYNDIIK